MYTSSTSQMSDHSHDVHNPLPGRQPLHNKQRPPSDDTGDHGSLAEVYNTIAIIGALMFGFSVATLLQVCRGGCVRGCGVVWCGDSHVTAAAGGDA